MLINKTFAALLLIAVLTGNTLAQSVLFPQPKPAEISPELRKNALDLLRETIREIPNLKAEENRHFFTIETARLLWKEDENEARRMIAGVIREFNKSWREVVDQARKANVSLNDQYYERRTGVKPLTFEQSQILADLRKSAKTRERLLLLLISADPEMAAQFVAENSDLDSLPGDQGYYSSVKPRIVQALLERNKVEKSMEIAREMLGREFSASYLDVLRRIYVKDTIKGRELAEETFRKIASPPSGYKVSTYHLYYFFEQSADSPWGNSDGMLSQRSLKALAALLGKAALTKYDVNNDWVLEQIARLIQKYSPNQAREIRLALRRNPKSVVNANAPEYETADYYRYGYRASSSGWIGSANTLANAANTAGNATNAAAEAAYAAAYEAKVAANKIAEAANRAAEAAGEAANSAANGPARKPRKTAAPVVPPKTEWEIRQERKAYLIEKLRSNSFTGAEKKKFIQDLKDLVYAENSYSSWRADGYISIVQSFSQFAAASSDREVSRELLAEAEIYVRPQAKTYADYLSKMLLAIGYSSTDPERSFAIMESLGGINDVLENMMKFGEFMDDSGESIIGREFNTRHLLQDRGLFPNLRAADFWLFLQNLAKADFRRTKSLAGKFDKREFKMTAQLLILESLLGEPK